MSKHGLTEPFFNVLGIVISVKLVQPLKTLNDIAVIFPKSTLFNLVQFSNALYPISVTEFGIVISVIPFADLKASSPNVTTVFPSILAGILTFPVKSVEFVHFKFSIWFELFNSYSQFTVTPFIVDVAV